MIIVYFIRLFVYLCVCARVYILVTNIQTKQRSIHTLFSFMQLSGKTQTQHITQSVPIQVLLKRENQCSRLQVYVYKHVCVCVWGGGGNVYVVYAACLLYTQLFPLGQEQDWCLVGQCFEHRLWHTKLKTQLTDDSSLQLDIYGCYSKIKGTAQVMCAYTYKGNGHTCTHALTHTHTHTHTF